MLLNETIFSLWKFQFITLKQWVRMFHCSFPILDTSNWDITWVLTTATVRTSLTKKSIPLTSKGDVSSSNNEIVLSCMAAQISSIFLWNSLHKTVVSFSKDNITLTHRVTDCSPRTVFLNVEDRDLHYKLRLSFYQLNLFLFLSSRVVADVARFLG